MQLEVFFEKSDWLEEGMRSAKAVLDSGRKPVRRAASTVSSHALTLNKRESAE
jgi:hypothetical protein